MTNQPPEKPNSQKDSNDSEADQAAILARRRKFIAVALAGATLGAACGPDGPSPFACLKVAAPPTDAGAPTATASDGVEVPPDTSGKYTKPIPTSSASNVTTSPTASEEEPVVPQPPRVCLRAVPKRPPAPPTSGTKTTPQVCLSF